MKQEQESNADERLEWIYINPEHNQVTVKSSKNDNARTLQISKQLTNSLLRLPKKQKTVFIKRAKGSRQLAFRTRFKKISKET
jgi:hypothetical protein